MWETGVLKVRTWRDVGTSNWWTFLDRIIPATVRVLSRHTRTETHTYRQTLSNTCTLINTHTVLPKVHYTRFPVTCPQTGKLSTVNLLRTSRDLLLTCWRHGQQVRNKLATRCCNGLWETTRHNRHNGLLPTTTCYRLVVYVANLLRTCYGEIGVMDFALYRHACKGKRGHIPLPGKVQNGEDCYSMS